MVLRFISSLELKLSSQRQRSYQKYGLSRSLSWEGEDKNRDPGFYGIIFWLFCPRAPTGIREGKNIPGDTRRSSLLGATLNFLGDLALIWNDQLLILSESSKSFCCLSPLFPHPQATFSHPCKFMHQLGSKPAAALSGCRCLVPRARPGWQGSPQHSHDGRCRSSASAGSEMPRPSPAPRRMLGLTCTRKGRGVVHCPSG